MTVGTTMAPSMYLITYESAHWCGAADTYVVVHADSAEAAQDAAYDHMEQEMRELFVNEYACSGQELSDDDEGFDDYESAVVVVSVEEFGPSHEQWKWFCDPTQRVNFYPQIDGNYFND